jgi:tetratricopeptide (TPR) repeat protein
MAEGIELITAATQTPGEVPDEIRAMVYALVVHFVGFGRGNEQRTQEWIHNAHRFSQRSQRSHPSLRIVSALERMLQAPEAVLPAWESLLDDEDPWVRALAHVQLGKMRIMLGQSGRDAGAYLELALAEFRVLGERFGIWFALTELAGLIATRGEFADACEHYEQAIAVFTEVGVIEDVIRMRARQAQLYWLLGDQDSSASAIAEAQRLADRVTWPDALAELALAKAELARWGGNAEEAYRQLGVAIAWPADGAPVSSPRRVSMIGVKG